MAAAGCDSVLIQCSKWIPRQGRASISYTRVCPWSWLVLLVNDIGSQNTRRERVGVGDHGGLVWPSDVARLFVGIVHNCKRSKYTMTPEMGRRIHLHNLLLH